MTTTHDLIEICKKLRYDLTAAQAKVTDVMQALDGANIKPEGIDPVEQIRRQIANGVVNDFVDLYAELFGAGLTPDCAQADLLRAELRARLDGVERANKTETQSEKSSLGVST